VLPQRAFDELGRAAPWSGRQPAMLKLTAPRRLDVRKLRDAGKLTYADDEVLAGMEEIARRGLDR
jgi:hypothetical protein